MEFPCPMACSGGQQELQRVIGWNAVTAFDGGSLLSISHDFNFDYSRLFSLRDFRGKVREDFVLYRVLLLG